MPEMCGIEATKIIRNEIGNDIHIVALTADAFLYSDAKFPSYGFDGIITKPINKDQLAQLLSKVAEERYPAPSPKQPS
jgi:CheY-like chemotaxis protein